MAATRIRKRLQDSARFRAWVRLAMLYPEDFDKLYAEELALGPARGALAGQQLPPPKWQPIDGETVRTIDRLANEGWENIQIAQYLGGEWTRERVYGVRTRRLRAGAR